MLSKSKSSGHTGSFTTSAMNKKKKPAPPRPPQPSTNRIQISQSFTTGSELRNRVSSQRSISITGKSDFHSSDLIDFNAAMESSPKNPSNLHDPPDFKYRVGASIFFIKSPLVNSVSNSSAKTASHPFSPPRPSAQALSKTGNSSNTSISHTTTTATKYFSRPTIIKPHQPSDDKWDQPASGSQYKGSTAATNVTSTNSTSRYSNVPLATWDEPPKKFPSSIHPTIIKPLPPPKKPGLGSKAVETNVPKYSFAGNTISNEPKPYYDEPPDFDDFDDDDDDDDDDFISKPMPNEPPPPPPPNNEVEEWIDGAAHAQSADYGIYSEPRPMEFDRAYAIALYDYYPEAEGDLALQAGDLIYLSRKIDESWLFGTCGGIQGMFPSNYVNVVVPLPEEEELVVPEQNNSQKNVEQYFVTIYAKIDYDFTAETESDLNLQAGEVVTILGRINDDWLYGELQGSRGQFPAAFVSPVPLDLPLLNF